jgi:glycosyltransferase involved in cell wall biosynthesis
LCLSYTDKQQGRTWDGNVCWESLNAGQGKFAGLMRYIARAAKKAGRTDVIWACSDSFYGIIGLWAARRGRIPLVFDLYDNFEFYLAARLPVVKQLYRRAVRHADAVTCISASLKNLIASYGRKENVSVLQNAVRADLFRPMDKVDCRRQLGLPSDAFIVGTAGALYHNRGIESLYSAFRKLQRQHPNLHLALAGPRHLPPPRDQRIHDLGILPFDTVPTLYNALDVAVVCNKDNAFGRYCHPQKAVEIMACNVPLVAARIGSLAQFFKTNPNWLYEPDNPASLAAAVRHRMKDTATNYDPVPAWQDQAVKLEEWMARVMK